MAAINFPNNPSNNDEYTHPDTGTVYKWNTVQWRIKSTGGEWAPVSYILPPSATFIDVLSNNILPPYSSSVLSFDVTITDIQKLNYSITDLSGLILREGTLSVKTLSTGVAVLDDEYSENRDVSVLPPPVGPDFSFDYTSSVNTITLTYKHNFASDVVLRVFTKMWMSYIA
jgi:hypothetical protein